MRMARGTAVCLLLMFIIGSFCISYPPANDNDVPVDAEPPAPAPKTSGAPSTRATDVEGGIILDCYEKQAIPPPYELGQVIFTGKVWISGVGPGSNVQYIRLELSMTAQGAACTVSPEALTATSSGGEFPLQAMVRVPNGSTPEDTFAVVITGKATPVPPGSNSYDIDPAYALVTVAKVLVPKVGPGSINATVRQGEEAELELTLKNKGNCPGIANITVLDDGYAEDRGVDCRVKEACVRFPMACEQVIAFQISADEEATPGRVEMTCAIHVCGDSPDVYGEQDFTVTLFIRVEKSPLMEPGTVAGLSLLAVIIGIIVAIALVAKRRRDRRRDRLRARVRQRALEKRGQPEEGGAFELAEGDDEGETNIEVAEVVEIGEYED